MMRWSIVISVSVAMISVAFCAIFAGPTVAAAETVAPAAAAEEGWSFDDIKDVCEAIHFVMISIGIGCGIYWFGRSWVPLYTAPRIEFAVDAERIVETETAQLVELVARVKNAGSKPAKMNQLQFTLRSVSADKQPLPSRPLVSDADLTMLFEAAPELAAFIVDAGTQRRCVLAATVSKTVSFAVVTAKVSTAQRVEMYEASKLVRLGG
jgi:hypothetical protein